MSSVLGVLQQLLEARLTYSIYCYCTLTLAPILPMCPIMCSLVSYIIVREEGREEGREGGREEGREGGREEGREGGREGGKKGGREGMGGNIHLYV